MAMTSQPCTPSEAVRHGSDRLMCVVCRLWVIDSVAADKGAAGASLGVHLQERAVQWASRVLWQGEHT